MSTYKRFLQAEQAMRDNRVATMTAEHERLCGEREMGYAAGRAWADDHWIGELPNCCWSDDLVIDNFTRCESAERRWAMCGIDPVFRGRSLPWREGYRLALAEELERQQAAHPAYLEVARLGHWISFAKAVALALWDQGRDFTEVRRLKTEFIQWNCGGTYRHRVLLVGATGISGEGGHWRPGIIGDLFGRGSDSKRGVIETPEGLEVYQDQ